MARFAAWSAIVVAVAGAGCSGETGALTADGGIVDAAPPSMDAPAPIDASPSIDAPAPIDSPATIDASMALGCGLWVTLTPAPRVQIVIWVERADGTAFRTVALTSAVAYRGIGNRPGALQMNSGFRWPYGRREGVLPVWAHRRAAAGGALFPRVVHQNRPEGFASRTTDDSSLDAYFCLSFRPELSRREMLDAVSCASPLSDDKGRYITDADVRDGYSEPAEQAVAVGIMRPLALQSLYPQRRDLTTFDALDHPDTAHYASDAFAAMPELDAVTMATPPGDAALSQALGELDAGTDYMLMIEISAEGDYDPRLGHAIQPTPTLPDGAWDYWAQEYGYPYLGQPSVVFRVPFRRADLTAGTWSTADAAGYSELEGQDGAIRPIDDTVVDDPLGAPGSGVDRLHVQPDGSRVRIDCVPCP